jgi:hypothetical protein
MQHAAKFPLALDPEPFYTCRTLHKTLIVGPEKTGVTMFWKKDVISAFAKKWKDEGIGTPETIESLKQLETAYSVKLPRPYREFMLKHGNMSTQRLMYCVTMGEYELPDLLMFFSVNDILERMKEYPVGLQEGFLCFAPRVTDGMFLFNIEECNTTQDGDAPVWIYSHEYREAFAVNDSFISFLESFLNVKK